MQLNIPLMHNNIVRQDLDEVIAFLGGVPRLTQSDQVAAFEREWSEWLGVKHSVFVNSGASANLATMTVLRHLHGPGDVIVPTLTWISDIASVIQCGFNPVFVDIDPRHLGMSDEQVISRLTPKTKAVFITHVQGFDALSDRLLAELERRKIPLVEDVCESHGATHNGRKLGGFGLVSNFSFYYAHHMSTIEGGMICTNDPVLHQYARMARSHGMVRESTDAGLRAAFLRDNPELNPEFIFAFSAFNMRNTEIGAVLGRSQLKRLDGNNDRRRRNLEIFLAHISPAIYRNDFKVEGSCNYAFPLVLRKGDFAFRSRLEAAMKNAGVEFRRGSSGGGNQLRQPYLRGLVPPGEHARYPEVEHIHHFGYYIGNYPELEESKIVRLCGLLNRVE